MSPCPAGIAGCPCSLERFCIPVLGCNLAFLTPSCIPEMLSVKLSDAQTWLVAVSCLPGPAELAQATTALGLPHRVQALSAIVSPSLYSLWLSLRICLSHLKLRPAADNVD